MLEKKYRLTKKEDFTDVFKKGVWVRGRLISLRIKKTASALPPRIGFVVGTKIAKKAVTRNKLKRQLRASFSRHIKEIKRGLNIVVVPAPEITKIGFQEISEEVERVLKKAHIL